MPWIWLILVAVLLVGARFNATWAGGSKYVRPLEVRVIDDAQPNLRRTIRRGETIRTEAGDRVEIAIGDTRVWLDERTDLTIESLDPDHPEARLHRGRTVFDVPTELTILTNETRIEIRRGVASIVNFDFQSRIAVVNQDAESVFVQTRQTGTGCVLRQDEAISVMEVPPFEISEHHFSFTDPSVSDFYTWVFSTRSITAPPSIRSAE